MLLRPGGDFGETKALDDGELHAQRVSLLVGLDGGDKGRLAGRATTALAAASLAPEIGVIELDPPAERVLAVALHHHLHQLVAHAPRRVVGDPQMAVQLHRRDAFLVLGHEVDGLKPHRQGQLGGVEDGAGGNRGLAVAAIALLELAAVELTRMLHKSLAKGLAHPMNTGLSGPIGRCASSSLRVTMTHTPQGRLSRRCAHREGLCIRSTGR